jgi:hypothetical protein
MSSGYGTGLEGLVVMAFVGVTLGVWKIVDIIIWICRHVHVSF